MELSNIIAARRSIRKFKQEDLALETVQLLLEAARLAPSASNLQPWRFVVAKSPSVKEMLGHCTPYKFMAKAAVIFICCVDLTTLTTRQRRMGELLAAGVFEGIEIDTGDTSIYTSTIMDAEAAKAYLSMNAAIAVEHIALKAVDLGLGSCWIGRFDRDKVKEVLALDEQIHPVVLLPVGRPAQSPAARPRLTMDQIVLKSL